MDFSVPFVIHEDLLNIQLFRLRWMEKFVIICYVIVKNRLRNNYSEVIAYGMSIVRKIGTSMNLQDISKQ